MALLPNENPRTRPSRSDWAPFALGFRPFFLAAGLYAILMIALWLEVLRGSLHPSALSPFVWHGHEMLFGFATAVIAGFLLTATQNWTGIRTPSGPLLAALFLLWLSGRLGFLIPGLPVGWIALIDLSFLPVLALTLTWPIVKTRQWTHAPFPLLLLALTAANGLVHAEALALATTASLGLHLAAYVIVTLIVIMGGRVIPSFTDNKLHSRARRWKTIERLVPIVTFGALLAAWIAPASLVTLLFAGSAAAVHGIRLAGWHTRRIWSVPLLWILHMGYAWLVIGFALLAVAASGIGTATGSALHAFTVGGIGVLTLGMMARVSLGHTGRMLESAPLMTVSFVAMNLAALIRVGVPLFFPGVHFQAMVLAGLLWIVAFGLFAFIYTPILLRPRIDGKPG